MSHTLGRTTSSLSFFAEYVWIDQNSSKWSSNTASRSNFPVYFFLSSLWFFFSQALQTVETFRRETKSVQGALLLDVYQMFDPLCGFFFHRSELTPKQKDSSFCVYDTFTSEIKFRPVNYIYIHNMCIIYIYIHTHIQYAYTHYTLHTLTYIITHIEHCCPMPSRRLYGNIKPIENTSQTPAARFCRDDFIFHNRVLLLLLFLLLFGIIRAYRYMHIGRVLYKRIFLSTSHCVDPYYMYYYYHLPTVFIHFITSIISIIIFFYHNVHKYA